MSKIENTPSSSGARDIEPLTEVRPQPTSALSHYQSIEQRTALERIAPQEELGTAPKKKGRGMNFLKGLARIATRKSRKKNELKSKRSEGFQRVLKEEELSRSGSIRFANPAGDEAEGFRRITVEAQIENGNEATDAQAAPAPRRQRTLAENKQRLHDFIDNPQIANKVSEELVAPLSELDVLHYVAFVSLMEGNQEGLENFHRVVEGATFESVFPNSKFKTEYETLKDSRLFLQNLDKQQGHAASLAAKMSDGSASMAERTELSSLLRSLQAQLTTAKEHVEHRLDRQAKKLDSSRSGVVISLQALSEKFGAHLEVVNSFLGRYYLPPVPIATAQDEAQKELIDLQSLSQALGTKTEQTKGDWSIEQLERAQSKVDKTIRTLKKNMKLQKDALDGDGNLHKRLAEKIYLSRTVLPSLELPPELEVNATQLNQARGQILGAQIWQPITHSVHLTGGDYKNTLTPLNSASTQFASPYVPNLATSHLENERAQRLYTAVRHGAINPADINETYLANLPRADLTDLLEQHYKGNLENFGGIDGLVNFVQQTRMNNPQGNVIFSALTTALKQEITNTMTREVAAAAITADETLYRKALSRGTPNPRTLNETSAALTLPLNGINLMGKGEQRTAQLAALRTADESDTPISVEMKNKETGASFFVPVRIQLREFNFDVETGGRSVAGIFGARANRTEWGFKPNKESEKALTTLLGSKNSNVIGGLTAEKLEQVEGDLKLRQTLLDQARVAQEENFNFNDSIAIGKMEQRTFRQAREGFTLSRIAEQLKEMWQQGDWTSPNEHHKFTARLALLCSQIGEVPVLSDNNGLDRVNGCDSEAKYLAGRLDSRGFPSELNTPPNSADARARTDFWLAGGGNEMRRYNDGLSQL